MIKIMKKEKLKKKIIKKILRLVPYSLD